MNFWLLGVSFIALLLIVGAIMLLRQSAKKFKLTDEQLTKINDRNRQLEKEEED